MIIIIAYTPPEQLHNINHPHAQFVHMLPVIDIVPKNELHFVANVYPKVH